VVWVESSGFGRQQVRVDRWQVIVSRGGGQVGQLDGPGGLGEPGKPGRCVEWALPMGLVGCHWSWRPAMLSGSDKVE
jgi:hypothetical protein